MFGRLFRAVSYRADELLVAAAVLVGAAFFYAPSLIGRLANSAFTPIGAESTQVKQAIDTTFSKNKPTVIVMMRGAGDVNDASFEASVTDVSNQINRTSSSISAVHTFYTTKQQQLVSKDGHATLALVSINGTMQQQQDIAARLREVVKSSNLQLSYAGEALLNHDITAQINKDLSLAETISFSILAVLLVIVFRGVVAALLPLLLGGFSVLVAMLVLRGLVEFTTIVQYALNVIILIGLGLAVDYSLLFVSRFREELLAQKGDATEALRITMQTAGRTIFFSGLTVIISLLSLLVFPLDFLRSMGLGGAVAVFVAMGGALVVLPSILRLLGNRINWLSFGRAKQMDKATQAGHDLAEKQSIWYKTGAIFMRRPAMVILVTLVVLTLAGMPFLRAKFATPDYTVLPTDSLARQATQQLQQDFNFSDSPVQLLYTTSFGSFQSPKAQDALRQYSALIMRLPNVQSVELGAAPAGKTALLNITYKTPAMSADSQTLVKQIRAQDAPYASVQVGGATAQLVDLLDTLAKYIPYAATIIGVTLFILLFLMLGSVVLPLVAMVQNVLSLAVSFGALVLIFQDGRLANLLHMNVAGSIDATQPVLIFVVAFGLSMDYSVFLYGRIKEEYDRTHNTGKAVLGGLQKTGGIITSAAVLLFVVVVAFATSRISIMQQIGVGLALAILVDAFVVRMVLVPATMKLLGRANWWAPASLKRLQQRVGLGD